MLQQTQAAVVIPYYLRWMKCYPTIHHLAEADISEVIKLWEGLGYYSRARRLHAGARYIVDHFNGVMPNSAEQLMQIKGLGPYTIGAILSFAFHQKKAAVDGNVLRVLTRYFQISEDIAKASTQQKIRHLTEEILPEKDPWIFSEALIELGATICQRKAQCSRCPLNQNCLSFRHNTVENFPVKARGPKTSYLTRAVAVIECRGEYLLRQGKKDEIMADLYEFLYFECQENEVISSNRLLNKLESEYQIKAAPVLKLPSVKHSFTRYQVLLEVFHLRVDQKMSIKDFEWRSLGDLHKLPFSSGHRRILQALPIAHE